MTINHPKFSIHIILQLFGLTTEKLLPTALLMEGITKCHQIPILFMPVLFYIWPL